MLALIDDQERLPMIDKQLFFWGVLATCHLNLIPGFAMKTYHNRSQSTQRMRTDYRNLNCICM